MNTSKPPAWLLDNVGAREHDVGFTSYVTERSLVMTASEQEKLERMLEAWGSNFPASPQNLMHRHFGVQSLIIRLDYVLRQSGEQEGQPFVYEVEDRPCGWAVPALVNPRTCRKMISAICMAENAIGKPIAFCVSEKREHTSDDAWFHREAIRPHLGSRRFEVGFPAGNNIGEHMWWVRSEDGEEEYGALLPHAVSTVYPLEGDKSYGVPMNLWKDVPGNPEELPWESGLVLKPRRGSRYCVSIVDGLGSRRSAGSDTKTKAIRGITEGRMHYWQPYVPHESHDFLTSEVLGDVAYGLLRRVFFAFDVVARKFRCIGGSWCAVPGTRGHGRADAVFGPVLLPEA